MRVLPNLKVGSQVILTCRTRDRVTGVVKEEKLKAKILTVRREGSAVEFDYYSSKKLSNCYEDTYGRCFWKTGEPRIWGIIGLEVI